MYTAKPLLVLATCTALGLAASPARASVIWEEPVSVRQTGGLWQATVQARLDLPFDRVAPVLEDVQGYDLWMPTVSEVREIEAGESSVRASFVHAMPLFPDFPCVVELRFQRGQDALRVGVRFIECIFDEQALDIALLGGGEETRMGLAWSARLDRWFVPGVLLARFLRSVALASAEDLDAHLHGLQGDPGPRDPADRRAPR